MKGYVVSRSGTFGTVARTYMGVDPVVLIKWGVHGFITPVRASECHQLASEYESEARQEAEQWLYQQYSTTPPFR